MRSSTTISHALPLALALALSGCPDDGAAGSDADTQTSDLDGATSGEIDGAPVDTDAAPTRVILHYHRADGAYEGWVAHVSGDIEGGAEIAAGPSDDFGATFEIPLSEAASALAYTLTKAGEGDPAEAVSVLVAAAADGIWHFSGRPEPLLRRPPVIPGPDQLAVYYLRDDGAYSGWGLHLWEDVATPTQWGAALRPEGVDDQLGAYWLIDLAPGAEKIGLIVHKGDEKDPGPDMFVPLSDTGDMVFLITGYTDLWSYPLDIPAFAIRGGAAHWIDESTIAWTPSGGAAASVELRYDPTGAVEVEDADVVGGQVIELTKGDAGLTPAQRERWPHLATRGAWLVDATDFDKIPEALKGELVVVARDAEGAALDATRVQTPGVIDSLYATLDAPLGLSWEGAAPRFALWAPTAEAVRLERYAPDKSARETLEMVRSGDGIWRYEGGDASWRGDYYRYEVTVWHYASGKVETFSVTDPYSVSLSTDSAFSQIIDLDAPDLKPAGWDSLDKPPLEAPEDTVIYEAHIRDFSAWDESVAAEDRGKYRAFTYLAGSASGESAGMKHLRLLAEAGLTHIHLLPAFDIATIEEDATRRVDLDAGFDELCAANAEVPAELCELYGVTPIADVLAGLDPATGDAQAIAGWMSGVDAFNWGYDPYHYSVPEGSYASTAEGSARVLEFREMVAALAQSGLRVVLDVVYNHTNAAGLGDRSVLDKIVPGYYYRLGVDSGLIETSTCCQNTATEHAMMERLMIDSLLLWAREYKVDGFRFDLMGHHMKANIEHARDALRALTLADDGVDGTKIILYGEGWDFGEVRAGARGVNATQRNMAGTGVGTFNDRMRDAVRGGHPFDGGAELRSKQGFINGISYDPNELAAGPEDDNATALELADQLRICLAGGLRDFRIISRTGAQKKGFLVAYHGEPTGYTLDPQESISYVSSHDNPTLFDNNAYKTPTGTSMADRVRIQNLGVSLAVLGQGVPFLHMGVDLLRSKSMERDSYNSGDWFNRVDFTYQTNNWNVGLPNAEKDEANWPTIEGIIADTSIAPMAAHIEAAAAHLREVLALRKSSPLLRLRTAEQVMTRVHFHNTGPLQVPGLIVMSVSDAACAGDDLDPERDGLLVVFNANDEAQRVTLAGASGWTLHALQRQSADVTVQAASFDEASGAFDVPARTAAVFERLQGAAQGDAPACNPL